MTDAMIEAQHLAKRYRLGEASRMDRTLPEAIAAACRRLCGLSRVTTPATDGWFHALRDVNLTIQRGEAVGIIGRNGAGKSTLLKILSQITPPSEGVVRLRGRVASLLEVGTGFHPELTGRENIYLNGAVLGLTRRDIKARFDEIVEFSGVERFLDTPIKRYSSGMTVRLAFAVAAHLEPEVLVVDEVLAVGDAAFQARCLGKMKQVAGQSGRTVLFVSHNMAAIRQLCTRAVLLRDGQVAMDDDPEAVIRGYLADGQPRDARACVTWDDPATAPGGAQMRLTRVAVRDGQHQFAVEHDHDQPIELEIGYVACASTRGARLVVQVLTDEGVVVFSSLAGLGDEEGELRPGHYVSRGMIPAGLLNRGRYVVAVAAMVPGTKALVDGREYLRFEVIEGRSVHPHGHSPWPGTVAPQLGWATEPTGDERALAA